MPRIIAGLPTRLLSRVRKLGWQNTVVISSIIVGVIVIAVVLNNGNGEEIVPEGERSVSLSTVLELSGEQNTLPVFGIVRSKSEALVRTETSAEVVRVNYSLGDSVSAGTVVAEMRNTSERAALLQAEAAQDVARAVLAKVKGSVRGEQLSILETNVQSAKNALESANTSAMNALFSSYDVTDDAISRKADRVFSNPSSDNPTLILTVADAQLVIAVENGRSKTQIALTRQKKIGATLTSNNIVEELTRTETELREIRNFLDHLISALNKTVVDQDTSEASIVSYKADASAARTNVTASLAALAGAREALDMRVSALDVANKNLEQGITGGQDEDVASAEASVRQAEAGLAAARAAFERTIIRAPISGTINFLSIERGDFIPAFTHVLTVANNEALEVVAHVSEADSRSIAVGSSVRIEDLWDGTMTKIAPVADPTTQRIEVRVGVDDGSGLINGQAVTFSVNRSITKGTQDSYTIPISALKIETGRTIVFSVNEESQLVAHPVVLGSLLGDMVEIEKGLIPELSIVLDARGLREGQKVVVRQSQ